jgi:hypothetical protein
MMLLQAQIQRVTSREILLWKTLGNETIPLLSMAHQNGRERAAWVSLRDKISSRNQTALCAVQRTTHSIHKNGELNGMAQYVSCTQLVLVIAACVHYENSV